MIDVREAVRAERTAVVSLVGRCSPAALFHRFHGYADPVAHVDRLWEGSADAVLLAWRAHRCVGIGEMSCDAEERLHIGVLVEDAYQRRGIGTRLLIALVSRARAMHHRRLHADILVDRACVIDTLRRIGEVTVSHHGPALAVEVRLHPPTGADHARPARHRLDEPTLPVVTESHPTQMT